MKVKGKFILLEPEELEAWLKIQNITRQIKLIQLHHTWLPSYTNFNGDNYFELCEGMEQSHLDRGFAEIAQNITIFPDGLIMICRDLNTIPAGIKGANSFGVCIENIGNFDTGQDTMNLAQKRSIINVTSTFLNHFSLLPDEYSVVYHHWYDLTIGKRIEKEGTGTTKSCPGTGFFGGNTIDDFKENLLPLL